VDEGDDRTLENGRAVPGEIQALLQEAVDRGLVPARQAGHTLCASDLRAWLKTYGIGVDCSGYVMYALLRLLQDGCAAAGKALDRDPRAIVGFVRAGWVHRELTGDPESAVRFQVVPAPGDARPGDVLTSEGHIRIVLRTARTPDGSVVMRQAESVSACGVPRGLTEPETDIGPRAIAVRYPAPERPIAAQMPVRDTDDGPAYATADGERAYVLGRLRAWRELAQALDDPGRCQALQNGTSFADNC
jgi:hypothetical protein